MDTKFFNWWNSDDLTSENPYEKDTAAFWAWEGWQAANKRFSECSCPGCGWMISRKLLEKARFDFMCPNCNEYRLSDFYYEMARDEIPSDKPVDDSYV